jgi:predicted membrane protein
MAYTLWGFLMFAMVLEGVEFASLVYRGREGIDEIMAYVTGPLVVPFFILQFGIGSLIPILLLSYMIWRGTSGRALVAGVAASALLVLLAVFMMRWNVVIGGQEIAKTGKGLLTYHPEIVGRESLLAAASVIVAPFILLWVMIQLFPPWRENAISLPLSENANR